MQYLKYSLILLFVVPFLAFSQQYKPGKKGGLYSTGQDNVDKGWFFGLGLTYMQPYSSVSETVEHPDSNGVIQSSETYFAQPKNTFGKSFATQFMLFAEIGKFKMTDRRFINYIDYGLSYKWFRGGEDYTAKYYNSNTLIDQVDVRGSYSDHLISANLNLGYRFDKTDDFFYVNGLGLNLDYHIIKGRTLTPAIPNNEDYKDGPNSFLGEMHYFFGMGFKKGRLIIMPIVETPILALFPFNHIVSTHPYYNTRARPWLIRVRFMFLKKGSKSCPAVYNPMGIDPNGNGPK